MNTEVVENSESNVVGSDYGLENLPERLKTVDNVNESSVLDKNIPCKSRHVHNTRHGVVLIIFVIDFKTERTFDFHVEDIKGKATNYISKVEGIRLYFVVFLQNSFLDGTRRLEGRFSVLREGGVNVQNILIRTNEAIKIHDINGNGNVLYKMDKDVLDMVFVSKKGNKPVV